MEYDNTNKVAIFKHDQKGNDKAPMYKGTLNVEGKEYEISLWVKESPKAGKYFQGSIQTKLQAKADQLQSGLSSNVGSDGLPF